MTAHPMTAHCQPMPKSLAEEMLQVVARAMCDRPGDNPAQRDSRTRQMVYTTLGLDPRDGLELILATLVFGHFNLILDSMHDVFQGQLDAMKARTKSGIVALDRAMIGLLRELASARTRTLAVVAAARPDADAVAPPVEASAPAAAASAATPARPAAPKTPAVPTVAAVSARVAAPAAPVAVAAPAAPVAVTAPAAPVAVAAPAAPVAVVPGTAAGPAPRSAQTAPMPPSPRTGAAGGARPEAAIALAKMPAPSPAGAWPDTADGDSLEAHVAAFEQALIAAAETLEAGRARDRAAAAGD